MWRMCSPRTWECQKPSGLRPEGCCHSISFGSADACTANGQMSALQCVYLSWLEISSFLRRSKCVPSGSTPPRARTMSGMPWTDCRAAIGTQPRVSDESILIPRHTPPKAGPRLDLSRRMQAFAVCSAVASSIDDALMAVLWYLAARCVCICRDSRMRAWKQRKVKP